MKIDWNFNKLSLKFYFYLKTKQYKKYFKLKIKIITKKEVIEEVNSEEWLERCSFPIGWTIKETYGILMIKKKIENFHYVLRDYFFSSIT